MNDFFARVINMFWFCLALRLCGSSCVQEFFLFCAEIGAFSFFSKITFPLLVKSKIGA